MTEKPEAVETATEPTKPSIFEKIEQFPGAPSKAQIENWKATHGDVFVSSMPISGNIYIYRPISRLEWKNLQSIAPANADPAWADEQIVTRCVLFPAMTVDKIAGSLAGTVETLAKQILSSSDFYDDNIAISLIHKL